ncbi:MAG: hypothetical protein IGS49_03620 [Chlorogloeopsis fritschii C42_A2020_084]|uniref:hypothetical protein n=1 Tax=Chlorogloeopsis fritschii TaxID=1124 RepID=UPI0019FEAE28|nr:hypothetical protein [Chlorogloeopsis fritschii]MBF2004563.1 hypothetical protein [Chlorogloeopsis fritschii C42_A2020_084]
MMRSLNKKRVCGDQSSVNDVSHPDINVSQSYELRCSTNISVAGVVYLLSRLILDIEI